MDLFEMSFGQQVDLDDPETYRGTEWENRKTTTELHQWAWSEMGKALYYMNYFHPEMKRDDQAKRVHGFCFWYANEWNKRLDDTEENRTWFRKFIFRFLDEVENQC